MSKEQVISRRAKWYVRQYGAGAYHRVGIIKTTYKARGLSTDSLNAISEEILNQQSKDRIKEGL